MQKTLLSLRRAAPIAATVVLLQLAFPPLNLGLLVFVALTPWIVSLRDTDLRGALRSSALFGFLYFGAQMAWLFPFVGRWTGSLLLAAVPWVLASTLAAIVWMPLGPLIHLCWARGRFWLIPLVWAAHEGLRAWLPGLAFPWGFVATPLVFYPSFVQHAAFGTVLLVSAWVVVPNTLLAAYLFQRDDRPPPVAVHGFRMGLVFVGLIFASLARFGQPPAVTPKVVTLGQTGVDMAFSDRQTRQRMIFDAGNLIAGRAILHQPDLLIFPEGFADAGPLMPPKNPLGPNPPVPTVFAGIRPRDGKLFATAFGYDGEWKAMDKTRLVVFGEYVPGRQFLPVDAFDLPTADLTPGTTIEPFRVNSIGVGPLICFEGVFAEIVERHCQLGAQILVQMSIDDWYEGTPAWTQLWMSSVWRSIESGLPIARVGSRGMSLATNARGQVIAMVPPGRMEAYRVEVGVPDRSDAFDYRTGFVWLCLAVAGFVGVDGLIRRKAAPATCGNGPAM